jgi:hypothetical protein
MMYPSVRMFWLEVIERQRQQFVQGVGLPRIARWRSMA